jgi:hypothetical protein
VKHATTENKVINLERTVKHLRYPAFSDFYSVFQGFSKAKSDNGGSIFKLKPIFDTAPAASKNKARFKSGQS